MLCLHSAFEVSRFTEIYTEPYQQSVRATELSARTVSHPFDLNLASTFQV